MKQLFIVSGRVSASKLVWAEDKDDAEDSADFDGSDYDWDIFDVHEADEYDVMACSHKSVWDGNEWRDAKDLLALCTPEALAEREEQERARAEWEAHPKLALGV